MKAVSRAAWGIGAVLLSASPALACPVCESETGQQVRAGVFNDQFWANVLVTLLPFPVLLAVVALIYFDVPWPWKKHEGRAEAVRLSAAPPPTGE